MFLMVGFFVKPREIGRIGQFPETNRGSGGFNIMREARDSKEMHRRVLTQPSHPISAVHFFRFTGLMRRPWLDETPGPTQGSCPVGREIGTIGSFVSRFGRILLVTPVRFDSIWFLLNTG